MAAEAAKGKKVKADKDQIAALAHSLRDKLTHGTYKYAAATFPFEVKNGTLRLKPTTLASVGAETVISGYVELASLRLDSEWVMTLEGGDDVPSVSMVLAGPLSNADAIAPVIDADAIESYLTMRRMQEDVERLETLDVSGRTPPPEAETKPPAGPLVDAKPIEEFREAFRQSGAVRGSGTAFGAQGASGGIGAGEVRADGKSRARAHIPAAGA